MANSSVGSFSGADGLDGTNLCSYLSAKKSMKVCRILVVGHSTSSDDSDAQSWLSSRPMLPSHPEDARASLSGRDDGMPAVRLAVDVNAVRDDVDVKARAWPAIMQ